MNCSPNEGARDLKPGGRTKRFEERGYLVHLSSENVVWSTIRVDPVMTEQFKSCLLRLESSLKENLSVVTHQKMARLMASPRYIPFL